MKTINFCYDWKFRKQEAENTELVNLPHDAMIHEKRDPQSPSGSAGAYFPGGVYEYEKTFFVPEDWAKKIIIFRFEGVYKNSIVYINDRETGGCAYGYSQFHVNAHDALNYGVENTIKVIARNNDQPNSRWYTGSGIYRPVWLLLSGKKHINNDGVKISTFSYSPAKIRVDTSHTGGDATLVEILDNGQKIMEGRGESVEFEIPNAKLWSDTDPFLYQCRVTLLENGVAIDEVTEIFGIRLVEWSAEGLFINGVNTLLRGGCIHHDNGILGARCYAESEERRIRILKRAGFNAIRSSHNPASTAMLAACDRYGIYVMDETWDMWYGHKSKYDYAADFMDNYQADIEAMVNRDFNHPSVIMYSIGNEISKPHEKKGIDLTREMTEYIHSLDKNRAVTCGVNLWLIDMAGKGKGIYKEEGGLASDHNKKQPSFSSSTLFNLVTSKVGTSMNKKGNSKSADTRSSPCLDALDIAGYNYASGRYPLEAKAHPGRIVVGTETFPQDIAKNWAMVKKFPYLIGDFMWTAWDYLGEAGLGAWAYSDDGKGFNKPYPWLLNGSGAIDILGNIGAEAEYAAVVWGLRQKPYIGVQPVNHPGVEPAKMAWRGTNALASWSWKNCEGNEAVVEVYADADSITLLLNDKTIGRKKVKNYKAVFKTRYVPGILSAIAYDQDGRELSRSSLASATGGLCIGIYPEKDMVKTGEILYVDINIIGENGVIESNADTGLSVTVEGGELLAFGSANPRTEESYNSGSFTTYYGKAQAVIRADKSGTIRITICSDDMQHISAEIEAIDQNMA
jgi:hypothetical protein